MSRLVRRLAVLGHLARRDFQLRYHGSSLGVLWTLGLPLTQLVVLVFLFGRVVPLGIEAYPAFVLTALLPWAWFSASLGSAGSLFIGNRDLVRHPDFAPATLVTVSTLSNLMVYVASLPLLVIVGASYDRTLTLALLALPVLLLVQGLLIQGLGLLVATLNVFYRDVQHLVGVALSLLFYLTPVFYRPQEVGAPYQLLFTANPLAVIVEGHRAIFFHGRAPAWGPLALAAVTSTLTYVLAHWIHRARQPEIVDVV